jgi:antitoxin ParD1/3/4
MTLSLPDQMKEWVESQAKSGAYSDASDYIRDLIRRDQERRAAIAEIQAAIDEAVESGEPRDFDFSDFKQRMRAQHGA